MGRAIRTLQHGWNLFKTPPKEDFGGYSAGAMTMPRPNRQTYRSFNSKSIKGRIYTRLAIDFAMVEFYHARLNEDDVAIDVVRDNLNDCLTLDPNIDQTAFAMKVDLALTMFENGHVAIVPTDADLNPFETSSYDIRSMRVATVAGWHAREVTLNVYDDRSHDDEGNPVNGGITKQVRTQKATTALIENPFFGVMNEPSGNLQRLNAKLEILDGIDEAAGSGKLDMLLQLPYTVRGASRQQQAATRRNELRTQLKDDELGIGYIDVSEKVIQLNRPINNKLLEEIVELHTAVYDELGLTREIMNGSADRDTINNYYDRTIEPIATAVQLEYKRKFLTKTARTRRQSIEIYRDPLKLVPMSELAEIMDKGTRSNVMTPNDMRPKIGLRPSKDPKANVLGNPNMPHEDQIGPKIPTAPPEPQEVADE